MTDSQQETIKNRMISPLVECETKFNLKKVLLTISRILLGFGYLKCS
jgi:hypothetical protein